MPYAEVPEAEQEEVRGWWAKLQAAKTVAEENKPDWDLLKNALDGKFPRVVQISKAEEAAIKAGRPGWTDQVVTNFCLRMKNDVDAQVGDGAWIYRYPRGGDVSDKAVSEVETLVERVGEQADVVHEFASTVPDVLSMGQTITWVGVGRDIVDPLVLEGIETEAADLIAKASQGIPVHPLPGMNFLELAQAALQFADHPDNVDVLTTENDANVRRLAVEAARMHDEGKEQFPSTMYKWGDVWACRTPYYTFCLIDASVTERKYAHWMARRVVLTIDEAKNLTAWKKKARAQLKPSEMGKEVGFFPEYSTDLSDATKEAIRSRVDAWEVWDRDAEQVHYIARGYPGYLEVDPRYPYNDESGRSIMPEWFPCEFGTPRQTNIEHARRVLGQALLLAMFPKQLEYIKLESAFCAGVKKAARFYFIDKGVSPDERDALERGVDGTTVERPETLKDGQEPVTQGTWGEVPVDYMKGMVYLQEQIARDCEMSGPAMMGTNVTPTLGQEEMAASGAQGARGGLINRMERSAGKIADMMVACVRRFYTDERVTQIMGAKFTTPTPVMVDGPPVAGEPDPETGQPTTKPGPQVQAVGEDGQPQFTPSLWEQYKKSSLCGDRIEVKFGPRGRGEDLAKVKVLTDFAAYLNTRLDPMGFPLYDTHDIDERIARMLDAGRLQDYVPSPAEVQARMAMQQATTTSSSGGDRSAPGGGRTDGRRGGDMRGPPASPDRQERHRGPPDRGDMETPVRRNGLS